MKIHRKIQCCSLKSSAGILNRHLSYTFFPTVKLKYFECTVLYNFISCCTDQWDLFRRITQRALVNQVPVPICGQSCYLRSCTLLSIDTEAGMESSHISEVCCYLLLHSWEVSKSRLSALLKPLKLPCSQLSDSAPQLYPPATASALFFCLQLYTIWNLDRCFSRQTRNMQPLSITSLSFFFELPVNIRTCSSITELSSWKLLNIKL